MIRQPVPFGDTPSLASGELSRVFAVRTVVDDRAHARAGECIDIRTIEPAGDAQSTAKGNKLRCHAAPTRCLRPRKFTTRDLVVTIKKSGGELRRPLH